MKIFEGKKLLVLGGFRLACDIIRHAKALGAYVIVADYIETPGKYLADQFVLISAFDTDKLEEFCRKEKVDGITTGFVDILLQPWYDICVRLGLPCYLTPKLIEVSTNKIAFKEACNKYGVPVPQTYLVGNKLTEEICCKIQYPVFVKPLDGSGSRGAGVCNNRQELEKQFAVAVDFSATKLAIVEDYIIGREFLLNIVAQDGEYRMVSMFDRYVSSDRGSAINYASMSMGPSKAVDVYLEDINDNVLNMFKSLGFKDGLFFLQGYSNGQRITFFEMGCRLGGSYYDLERYCIGVDPIDMIISHAIFGTMGENIRKLPKNIGKYNNIAVCVNYLLDGKKETIHKISGLNEIKQLPSLVAIDQVQFEGYHYESDKTVDKPVLSVYLAVDNIDQLVSDVNYMNSVFSVENEQGESLLKEKFVPNILLQDF